MGLALPAFGRRHETANGWEGATTCTSARWLVSATWRRRSRSTSGLDSSCRHLPTRDAAPDARLPCRSACQHPRHLPPQLPRTRHRCDRHQPNPKQRQPGPHPRPRRRSASRPRGDQGDHRRSPLVPRPFPVPTSSSLSSGRRRRRWPTGRRRIVHAMSRRASRDRHGSGTFDLARRSMEIAGDACPRKTRRGRAAPGRCRARAAR